MKMLDEHDLNELERREMLIAIHGIVQQFVDMGWEEDAVSLAKKAKMRVD